MDDIKKTVRDNYGAIARKAGCGCGPVTPVDAQAIGYSSSDMQAAPEGSNLGLGCGNPLALADLRPGETVLDLGAGAGFDCFLAGNAVGPQGRVIGVDMTEEMVMAARERASSGGYENVEFRLGEIESLPLDDASVDVVISNCVINLVPDKQRAFAEAFRVLKPRGRLHLSDIVLDGQLPPEVLDSAPAYVNCVAGAVTRQAYLEMIQAAGLGDIRIHHDQDASALLDGCCEAEPGDESCGCTVPPEAHGLVRSITLSARKPSE